MSMLEIPAPNTDRTLLTIAELRAAAGVSDSSQDAQLTLIGNYVSAAITKACKVAISGVIPPTLRLETVIETIRLGSSHKSYVALARRAVTAIISVSENTTALDTSEWELDGVLLYKLSSDTRLCWGWPGDMVIEYSAGYAVVPDDLKYAAMKFVQAELSQGARDPMLKRVRIEGVSEREYWVDPTKDNIVPAEVYDLLEQGDYINKWGWIR
jgi:hypothetical protein